MMAAMTGLNLTRWPHREPPTEEAVEAILRDERLTARWWSNAPGDRYGAHSHAYHKVLYCVRGSVRFVVHNGGQRFDLSPGDRLDIPPGTPHSAVVGREGVTCVEASRE